MSNDILDDYLSGESELTSLYAQTKTPADVPQQTEDAILAAAKRELNTGPDTTVQNTHHAKRWMLPFSAAAVVVLSATVYISNEDVIHSQAPVYDQSDLLESKQEQSNQPVPASNALNKSVPAEMKQSLELDSTQAKANANESRKRMASPARSMAGVSEEALSSAAPATLADSEVSGRQPLDRSNDATPEAWLAQISQSLEQGDRSQAKAALKAFVLTYPDYSLPVELKALLTE